MGFSFSLLFSAILIEVIHFILSNKKCIGFFHLTKVIMKKEKNRLKGVTTKQLEIDSRMDKWKECTNLLLLQDKIVITFQQYYFIKWEAMKIILLKFCVIPPKTLYLKTTISEFGFTNLEHFVLPKVWMIDTIKQYYLQVIILP